MIRLLFICGLLISMVSAQGQFLTRWTLDDIDYANPRKFEIGGITVSGTTRTDRQAIRIISGLLVGEEIMVPGEQISEAIHNLWKQELFSDVSISATKILGDKIFLDIHVEERPRLSKFRFAGRLKKGEVDDIRDKIKLVRGQVMTAHRLEVIKNKTTEFFVDKGYLNAQTIVTEDVDDSSSNVVIVTIHVDKGQRVKINDIIFHGNNSLPSGKLWRQMKDTKRKIWYNILTSSKIVDEQYEEDKQNIIKKYNESGFRDARIVKDSIYKVSNELVNIEITIDEGNKYYIRNIEFVGNTKYKAKDLHKILNIKKGDIYNQKTLDTKLFGDPNGRDVSSLYLDNGYLFFSVDAKEKLVENDSIDLEIQIYEGKQAIINEVRVMGNTKTNDHVIMREIRTKPGNLFRRSDIIRTQRELIATGYFDQQQLGVNPIPNPESGTVDIEYTVVEKPSDQIQLSAGWGGNRIVGTLGLSFNNFSAKSFFKKGAWRPLPSGDGQKLSIRAQSTGTYYQSYNLSFTEPWLGGKKPNSFTISAYHSFYSQNGLSKYLKDSNGKYIRDDNGDKIINDARAAFKTYGTAIGLGRRLKWPDDFFTLYNELGYQYFVLENSTTQFVFSDGYANNLSFKTVLSRNSLEGNIYYTGGSNTSLTLQVTPPYSMFRGDVDYSSMTLQQKFNMLEYHKWKLNTQWFFKLAGNLVLNTKAGFGYLGAYNKELGTAPFERFYVGGDGLSNFRLDGREIIRLRGYQNGSLSPSTGAAIVSKYTMELRYPLTLNPSAMIFGLAFLEAGNSVIDFKNFRPFEVRRSAGVGVRIFMPMFGLLGLDWGYPLDLLPGQSQRQGQIHFTIGGNFNGW